MKNEHPTGLIAIVGGSGAGKSWLAERLQRVLGPEATRLSLDEFYQDRSHLPISRRARINFDHPRAIDWALVETVLCQCRAGRAARLPRYSFITHTRISQQVEWSPKPFVLVDGLWLLCRPRIRALFDLRIFLECPAQLRLERRLARDVAERGRTPDSIREQFWKTVAPMHNRYVAPQARWADAVVEQPPSEAELSRLIRAIRGLNMGGARALANGSFSSRAPDPGASVAKPIPLIGSTTVSLPFLGSLHSGATGSSSASWT
jgi:uridine kinase